MSILSTIGPAGRLPWPARVQLVATHADKADCVKNSSGALENIDANILLATVKHKFESDLFIQDEMFVADAHLAMSHDVKSLRLKLGFMKNQIIQVIDLCHVTVMWSLCDRHVTGMWLSCDRHVTIMWSSCDRHVIVMWSSCDRHVTVMWSSCDRHVIFMWHSNICGVMWAPTLYHVIFMWIHLNYVTCDNPMSCGLQVSCDLCVMWLVCHLTCVSFDLCVMWLVCHLTAWVIWISCVLWLSMSCDITFKQICMVMVHTNISSLIMYRTCPVPSLQFRIMV